MRILGNRRAVRSASVAVVAAVALAGCSAGQVAETAIKRPSNPGVNVNNSNNTVGIRNLAVTYPGPAGFPAGSAAPLEMGLFNLTTQPITVLISSTPEATSGGQTVVGASSVQIFGGSSAGSSEPTPSGAAPSEAAPSQAAPSESAASEAPSSGAVPSGAPSGAAPSGAGALDNGRPARIVLAPLSSASFLPGDPQQLRAVGLSRQLAPGYAVTVTFEFSNGAQPLTVPVPVAPPLSPAPRGSAVPGEDHEVEG